MSELKQEADDLAAARAAYLKDSVGLFLPVTKAYIDALEVALGGERQRVQVAREALEPFAATWDTFDEEADMDEDFKDWIVQPKHTPARIFLHYKRAAAALRQLEDADA